MKKLWAEEIDHDLRMLEDYVLDLSSVAPERLGTNLLAKDLGPDAPYAKFSPRPGRVTRQVQTDTGAPIEPRPTVRSVPPRDPRKTLKG